MAVYKDGDKWRVIYRYTNWDGVRKQTQKRGFLTKRDAQSWEHEMILKQQGCLDIKMETVIRFGRKNLKTVSGSIVASRKRLKYRPIRRLL